jgi:hypothetical protein
MVWVKRIALCICAFALAAAVSYWLWLPSAKVRQRESYAAMSAYLNSGLTGESHSLGSTKGLVVIYGFTSNGMFRILPVTWSGFGSLPVRVEATVRSLFPERLERKFDLPTQYVFTQDYSIMAADLTEEQRRASYGTVTFSKVAFNHDATRAVFYTEHLCGLCGEGKFVVMEKRGGKWVVVHEQSTWVS